MQFGTAIKQLRLQKNVGLRCFAGEIGVEPSRLSHIEAGFKRATPDEVELILTNLGESHRDDLRELANQPLEPKRLRDLLPVFICGEGKRTEQQLDKLVEAIRGVCECPIKED